jgi:hypothetical protein
VYTLYNMYTVALCAGGGTCLLDFKFGISGGQGAFHDSRQGEAG